MKSKVSSFSVRAGVRLLTPIRLPGVLILLNWISVVGGCSTLEVTPEPVPEIKTPAYVQVAHPLGYDLADLRAIFHDQTAPEPETLKGCDADYLKLKTLTQSEGELKQGTRELVKQDPLGYHWCFYNMLYQLDHQLKADIYVDERQRHVIETYQFVTPIARAFMEQYRDSRYMRWAIRYYRQVSEYVFFRRVELTPQMTSELVDIPNPFGGYRELEENDRPLLEKYNLGKKAILPPKTPEKGPEKAEIAPKPASESISSVDSSSPPADVPSSGKMEVLPVEAPMEHERKPATSGNSSAAPPDRP